MRKMFYNSKQRAYMWKESVVYKKKKLGININQLRKLKTNSLKIIEQLLQSFVIICLYNNSILLGRQVN